MQFYQYISVLLMCGFRLIGLKFQGGFNMKYFIENNIVKGIGDFELHLVTDKMKEVSEEEAFEFFKKQFDYEYSMLSYKEKRKQKYPPIEDYIDGIVKGDTVQVQEYIDKCLAVKAKYPKQ